MGFQKRVLWVVYQMTIHGKEFAPNAVCKQSEWDRMQLRLPGYHTLIRAGIPSEGEAEKLARGTSGDPINRRSLPKSAAQFFDRPAVLDGPATLTDLVPLDR